MTLLLEHDQPSRTRSPHRLLTPGRNCWRIERAHRFALLIDADAYFRALRRALVQARHSIFILSWDIDSRMRLIPTGANDGFPEPLGDFLNALVARRTSLRAYVLNWDFIMLYQLDREWLPVLKLGWKTHPRLEFRLDSAHPAGACHHQKVVVIDDRLAFVGGLDPTHSRWDTPGHACDDPLRCDVDGKLYSPFHDVQAMFDGTAAAAMGELARDRWCRAGGQPIRGPESLHSVSVDDPWPVHVRPEIADVNLAIARTDPASDGRAGVNEILKLHLDGIARAEGHIYLENQYFTAATLAGSLSARLREETGPEVVLISRRTESGWLEEATMGILRARLHRQMKEADLHGRYRAYYPNIPGLEQDCLNVHSKVMIIDDSLLSVGSANLNNRSMALDTECNVAIESGGDERIARFIAGVRNRLLGEHLGKPAESLATELQRSRSLIGSMEKLRGPGRSLEPLEPVAAPEQDELLPTSALFDPEKPIDAESLVAMIVPRKAARPALKRIATAGAVFATLVLLAAAWRWSPLADWVNLRTLIVAAQELGNTAATPFVILAAYVIGGFLVVPVMLLIAVTGVVFGPLFGTVYALAGSVMSAAACYYAGHRLGRDTVRRLAGTRINRLSRRIAQRGLLAMVLIRLLPLAPFTVVNIVAGASHIRLRDFLLGTLIGMTPGVIVTTTFVHQLVLAIREPSATSFAILAAAAILIVWGARVAYRRLTRRMPAL